MWRGMLWVHPKPDAPPIGTWFDGIWERLGPHNPNRLIEYPDTTYERIIQANWKIVVENFIDVYHLSHLHANTLNMYDHKKAQYQFIGDHYVFWEPHSRDYSENLDQLMPFKRIAEMTDKHLGAFVPWLFPNLGLSETESSWSTFHAIPLAPDQTKVVVRTKLEPMTSWEYSKQQMKAAWSWHGIMGSKTKYGNEKPDHNSDDPMEWNDFMEEDVYACEQQQKSLKNPLFDVRYTAQQQESTIRKFQEIIQQWMQEDSV